MGHRESHEQNELNVIEAVETLTSIADLEVDSPIIVAEKHELQLQELPIIYSTVHWLHRKNAERILSVVKDTYRVILHYLKHFYKQEYNKILKHQSVEGIKTVMVLVGEAAKKVDKYNRLFVGAHIPSIKETKEFRDLLTFYRHKIAPIAVQESLTKWIHNLPFKVIQDVAKPKALSDVHKESLVMDMDSIKKDTDYELFLIRKEDGLRFFSPRLLRNMKLVCNFEEHYGEKEVAVIQELKNWHALSSQNFAKNILRRSWALIDLFVKNAHKMRNHDLAHLLYQAAIALMLAANQGIPVREYAKNSSRYFFDFQKFLRQLLSSANFQRLVTYPPKNRESISSQVITLSEHLCRSLFTDLHSNYEFLGFLNELIIKGKEEMIEKEAFNHSFAAKMNSEYEALCHAMREYSHVRLINTLEMLQEGDITEYDPWLVQNFPEQLFDLQMKHHTLSVLRIPSPCTQNSINSAHVLEEFKGFLRSKREEEECKPHLLFNLQDRTEWKEFARCQALEELQTKEEFSKTLCVVSMTKASDFYHQTGPYEELSHAQLFIEQLLEHIQSESSGYFYPQSVKKILFKGFTKDLATAIHQFFFREKNVLSKTDRQNFIEFFYLLIQLKIIETVQPLTMSFSCKDALDIGTTASCAFFLFLKFINARPFSPEEEEYLKLLLHSPSILLRGRTLFPERFHRLYSCLKLLETEIEEQTPKGFSHAFSEHIAPLFAPDILSAVVAFPSTHF